MEAQSQKSWEEANKDYLMAHLERVRQALKHANGVPIEEDVSAVISMGHAMPAALEILVSVFQLSAFERDILLLCAGVELDSEFAALCAILQGGSNFPTFHLALSILSHPHWTSLVPDAPLRHWRLIEVESTRVLTLSPLHIDERILHYLVGVSYLDKRLAALLQPLAENAILQPSHLKIAQEVLAIWEGEAHKDETPALVQFCGSEPACQRNIAGWLASHSECSLFLLSASMLPTNAHDLAEMLLRWERETALNKCLLLLDCYDLDRADSIREHAVTRFIEANKVLLCISSRERRTFSLHTSLIFDIQKPTANEQWALWQTALGAQATSLNGQVSRIIAHFQLNESAISAIGAGVQGRLLAAEPMSDGQDIGEVVWNLCRTQARPLLDDLAERIEPVVTWADLAVSDAQSLVLHEIAMHVRQRTLVYETWGFKRKSSRSLGISALFTGASGVGKTMAAEVLANELHLDLYRIDLSMAVSKYIGETEKNLRRIFDSAEEGGVILLFDEADALFGKRSEVKDSHDRHANIEVSYLLQRMETYRGLAILTSNVKDALDPAFLRRIRFIVPFPFPDSNQRAEIWRRMFPDTAPTEGLDVERLAQLNLAGGNIRNVALNAAFIAADAGASIRMEHILRAARHEYAKLEKTLTTAETRGWDATTSN